MSDTEKYAKRIQQLASSEGIQLTETEANNALLRISEAVKEIYQFTKNEHEPR